MDTVDKIQFLSSHEPLDWWDNFSRKPPYTIVRKHCFRLIFPTKPIQWLDGFMETLSRNGWFFCTPNTMGYNITHIHFFRVRTFTLLYSDPFIVLSQKISHKHPQTFIFDICFFRGHSMSSGIFSNCLLVSSSNVSRRTRRHLQTLQHHPGRPAVTSFFLWKIQISMAIVI